MPGWPLVSRYAARPDRKGRRLALRAALVGATVVATVGTVAAATAGGSGPATQFGIGRPVGLAVSHGYVYLTGRVYLWRVRASTGWLTTVAGNGQERFNGDGGPASKAGFASIQAAAIDSQGNVAVADSGVIANRVRLVAARTGTFFGQPMQRGHIYAIAGDGKREYSGDGGPATSAGLGPQAGLAFDAHGNLVVSDLSNNRVRLVAASTGTFYGQAMTVGHIYTIAGDGTAGFAGDGGPAVSAQLGLPWAATVDRHGNVLFIDLNNNRVRVVAAATGTFYGVPMTAGDIYTVAGGGSGLGNGVPALSAGLSTPEGLTIDRAGNLVIADTFSSAIRVVATRAGTFYGRRMKAGYIYRIAGTGHRGFAGDGGPARAAELRYPDNVSVDPNGNLLIADLDNFRIRLVAGSDGVFYRQHMTAGDIYTIAGDGHYR